MNNVPKRLTKAIILGTVAAITITALADGTNESDPQLASHGIEIRVVIENLSPEGGTWLTPVWVGFHDGSFDTYDRDHPASAELERIAEDGETGPLMEAFALSGAGDIQGTMISDMGIPPIAPGETATMTFTLSRSDRHNRFFSYASMVIPSNDAFIANRDPRAYRLFRGRHFRPVNIIVRGFEVNDAGTELNDEEPINTAFFGQADPDTGQNESTVVHDHIGYKLPGAGGILDDPEFSNGDFRQHGYRLARIRVMRAH